MSEREGPRGGGLPANPPRIPGLPSNATFYELSEFKGLNVKAPRTSIDAQEMAWCHNLVPLHPHYLHSIPDNGPPFFSLTGPTGATGATGATGPTGMLIIDGTANNTAVVGPGQSPNGVVTLTTTMANDVIVLHVDFDSMPPLLPSVTSVSGGGLVWQKRAGINGAADNGHHYGSEVWWAIAPTPLTAVNITVTPTTSPAGMTMTVIGVNGANLAAPWDINPALPAIAHRFTAPAALTQVPGVSTTNPNAIVLFQYIQFDYIGSSVSPTPGSFGSMPTVFSQLGNAFTFVLMEDATWTEIVSSTLTNVTLNTAAGFPALSHWIIIADALQAA